MSPWPIINMSNMSFIQDICCFVHCTTKGLINKFPSSEFRVPRQLKFPASKLLTPPRSLEVSKSSVEEESFSVSINIIQC